MTNIITTFFFLVPFTTEGWILSKEAAIGILDATVSSGLCYALSGDKPGFSRVRNYAMSSDTHNANPKAHMTKFCAL